MSLIDTLKDRAADACELCGNTEDLVVYEVGPDADGTAEQAVLLCPTCVDQVDGAEADPNHWRGLSAAMWSEQAAVQVLSWRMLDRLKEHDWARDLLDMLYLEEDRLAWAQAGATVPAVVHRDSNGTVLSAGDTVTLIKDLPVKGAGFTAKRGTAVRGIGLVADNAGHIEGRVEGQRIVILTEFVKKR